MSDAGVDLSPIADLYRESLDRHGASPQGVGWKGVDAQALRFQRLLTVMRPDEGPVSVADLGCGYGALHSYMAETGVELKSYRGYDISQEMLDAARERLPASGVDLMLGDRVTDTVDYAFAAGIFNVRLAEDEERWEEYARSVVRNLAERSGRGFGFNMLTTYCDYREDHLYYGDPREWFDWCKREVSPRCALLHDYPLYEWTLTGRVA